MAEPGGVRSSWGKGLPSSRHYEPESESRRYEAPVFTVPHSPSTTARRHSVSAANLAETLKQRNMVPIASLQKSRDRLSVSALNLSPRSAEPGYSCVLVFTDCEFSCAF